MKHVYHIGGALLIYALAVHLISSAHKKEVELVRAHPFNPALLHGVDWFPGHGLSIEERIRYLRGVENRSDRLAALETERGKLRRAGERMEANRNYWQWDLRAAWETVVKTNYSKYEELLALAGQNPEGTTPCALCDGTSYMPCILCESHDGKCRDCGGRGSRGSEYCPTCLGSGHCFLCSGYGKMFCPFCDDGTIEMDHPEPLALPPIN